MRHLDGVRSAFINEYTESASSRFDEPVFPGQRYCRSATSELLGAKIIVRRFDGPMAFVPEGQTDRSPARSAWVTMQRDSRPEGRSKSLSVPLSVPQIFVVETEPRHEPATARLP
jgi:hypothetical protein